MNPRPTRWIGCNVGKGRGKDTDKREKFTDWKNTVWVLNNLDENQLGQMDSMDFDGERYTEFLEKCVDNGLSIKTDWDDYSECYKVTATGAWKGFRNTGVATQARSSELADCYKILWFKISEVADWDLAQFIDKSPNRRKRG